MSRGVECPGLRVCGFAGLRVCGFASSRLRGRGRPARGRPGPPALAARRAPSRSRPPHLGFQQCGRPSRCGAEPPSQQEPSTRNERWRRHDADDDGNGRYAGARRPARIAPRPRRPLSSVGQSCGLLIRRSWVRAPQGVPRKSQCHWLKRDVEPSLKPATTADYRTSVDRTSSRRSDAADTLTLSGDFSSRQWPITVSRSGGQRDVGESDVPLE